MFGRKNTNTPPPQQSYQANPYARVSLDKVPVSLRKDYNDAGKVLVDLGVKVPLAMKQLLDRSGSMGRYFRDGTVYRFGEQTLAATANVDDDGEFQCGYYDSTFGGIFEVNLDNYQGVFKEQHEKLGRMGTTNTIAGMKSMYYDWTRRDAKKGIPGVCIVQTDGRPDDEYAVEDFVVKTSPAAFHWVFVAYGPPDSGGVKFLSRLDNLDGRTFDNVTTYKVGAEPKEVSNDDLFRGLFKEIPGWLKQIGAQ